MRLAETEVAPTGRVAGAAWLSVAALAVATMLGGCPDDPPALCFQVQVYSPSGHDPFTGVEVLRLMAQVDGVPTGDASIVDYTPGGAASVPYVPYGSGVQIVVEGWTKSSDGGLGTLVSRGRSIPTSCSAGQEITPLAVQMARVNDFARLTNVGSRQPVSLTDGRVGHTATVTAQGEIVIAGGQIVDSTSREWWKAPAGANILSSVEVINSREFIVQKLPTERQMFNSRVWHTGTALDTGDVLLAGGYANIGGDPQPLRRVEIYSPARVIGGQPVPQQSLVLESEMAAARAGHTATLLDGAPFYNVLMVGGDDGGTYEVWNPSSGSTGAKEMPAGYKIRHHTAVRFTVNSGGQERPQVLIAGGEDEEGNPLNVAFIYDPPTDRMIQLPQTLVEPRTQLTGVFVPERNFIYLIGGYTAEDRSAASARIDVFTTNAPDPANALAAPGGFTLKRARGGHSAVHLGGNNVLIVGGTDGIAPLDEIELVFEFVDTNGNIQIDTTISGNGGIPYLPEARAGAAAAFSTTGIAVITGGASNADPVLPTSLVFYNPL